MKSDRHMTNEKWPTKPPNDYPQLHLDDKFHVVVVVYKPEQPGLAFANRSSERPYGLTFARHYAPV